jgi:NAD(P)-dependent dehydrogenase (short-subunit alcohol dehydrogenase family)
MDLQTVNKLYDFTGRTIVISGGAGVLASEIACALVGCNANAVILDRDMQLAEKVIERFASNIIGRGVRVYADVLNIDSLHQALETINAEFGSVDILINAAGGNHPSATTRPDLAFFDLPLDALRHVSDLNLLGTILPCQVFGRAMAEREAGGDPQRGFSMNAFRPLTRIPAYSAAKSAVKNFTEWLAVHMAQEYSPNIRVNAIAPGFFLTNQNRFLLTDEKTGELTPRGSTIIAHTPQHCFGTPEDLLGTTLWLISPAASFVTGIVVPVDGGFSAFSGV